MEKKVCELNTKNDVKTKRNDIMKIEAELCNKNSGTTKLRTSITSMSKTKVGYYCESYMNRGQVNHISARTYRLSK